MKIRNTEKGTLLNHKILLIGMMIFIFIGCSAGIRSYLIQKNVQIKGNTISYLGKEHTPDEIEHTLTKAFHTLNKSDNTEIMDLYLHATYALAMQNIMDDTMTNSLYSVMDHDKTFHFDKLSDANVIKLCNTLGEQHIVPRFSNGNLFFDVDYNYFVTKYGTYLNDDYVSLISLYDEEKKIDYYNPENNRMNYDEVEKRMLAIYDLMITYPKSDISSSMKSYYDFYKTIYLGAYAQDYVFDSGLLKEELFNRYTSFSLIVKDPDYKKFLIKLIQLYQNSEMTRTSEIYEQIQNYCKI